MLGSKEEFKNLRAELVPSLATASKFKPIDFRKLSGQERKEALKPVLAGMDPAEKGFMLEVIQLMQNVHTEFRLEHASNRSNPRNAGWMATFRDWASRPALQAFLRDWSERLFASAPRQVRWHLDVDPIEFD